MGALQDLYWPPDETASAIFSEEFGHSLTVLGPAIFSG
jgi:hypothetical protein